MNFLYFINFYNKVLYFILNFKYYKKENQFILYIYKIKVFYSIEKKIRFNTNTFITKQNNHSGTKIYLLAIKAKNRYKTTQIRSLIANIIDALHFLKKNTDL